MNRTAQWSATLAVASDPTYVWLQQVNKNKSVESRLTDAESDNQEKKRCNDNVNTKKEVNKEIHR